MVDAVNNNQTYAYTGIGAAAGLAAGGAYGAYFSKPLLDGDAPSDAFVKQYMNGQAKAEVKNAGEAAKKALIEADGYKDATIDDLKATINSQAEKFGLKAEVDADNNVTKTLDKVIEEFIGEEKDVAKLKGKMEDTIVNVAEKAATEKASKPDELISLKNALKNLKDDADAETVKGFVKEHQKALGLADDAAESVTNVTDLKAKAKNALSPLDNAKKGILAQFEDGKIEKGLKKLAEDAGDDVKNAFKTVKDAATNTRLWAGAKWAAIAGVAVGLASFIGAKLAAPKAPDDKFNA